MTLTNCSRCQYFDCNPHHPGDIVCSLNPAYAQMYRHLKSLDSYTVDCLPVDDCREFKLNPTLSAKELRINLTFNDWLRIAHTSSNSLLLQQILEQTLEFTISLTVQDWQNLASQTLSFNTQISQLIQQQGIELNNQQWIEVDSECISAISFDRLNSTLQIRFVSGLVYQYEDFLADTFQDFFHAHSKGRFFNQYIKDVLKTFILIT